MILSIHIPKTGGTSFGLLLQAAFGQRLMLDYGDWAGFNSPEAIAHRARRAIEMRGRRDELSERYQIIHGHFIADKYVGLFAATEFAAFFRDPYQRTLSQFHFLAQNPQIDHPAVRILHENKMDIFDYIKWQEVGNVQSSLLGSIAIDDFAVVGLTEAFPLSVDLFNRTFGYSVAADLHANVNAARATAHYEVAPDVKRAVETFLPADIELYQRAKQIFARQTARYR
jgi:hypothetical protein